MHKLLYLMLIFGFVVLINCKGGGGRGGGGHSGGRSGGSSYGHRGGGSGGGGSVSDVLLYAILIPCGLGLCCCCLYSCCQEEKGEPSQTNETFVAANSEDVEKGREEVYLHNTFQSGTWSCRYFQYDEWHGPHLLSLFFDYANMTIKGSGSDDVGTFTVDGIYSGKTRRMGLTQHYQPGTGDLSQNLGHDVTIQLIYNPRSNKFEGTWYVQTHKYHGENEIELKFLEPQA